MKSYLPGTWYAVLGDQVTVLLPPTAKARVAGAWSLVEDGAAADSVLDALLADGLSSLEGLGLLETSGDQVRALFRGNARATFDTEAGPVVVDGTGTSPWADVMVDGVRSVVIEVDSESLGTAELPIAAGLVRIAQLRSPAVAPAPVAVAPVPVAEAPVAIPDAPAPVFESTVETPPSRMVPPAPMAAPAPVAAPANDLTLDPYDRAPVAPGFAVAPEPPTSPFAPAPGAPASYSVATLLLSSGASYAVDRAILFGRAPEARRFQVGDEPLLVSVPSPNQEISGTHLEIRPGTGAEHGSAVVTDLGSTNGTIIIQPGLGPEELQAGIAVQLLPGAIVDLGDGVTIQVGAP